MHILMVTPVIPTVTDGRRPYNFIRYLARNHKVSLVSLQILAQGYDDIVKLAKISVNVHHFPIGSSSSVMSCVFGLAKGEPLRVAWCRNAGARKAIGEIVKDHPPDIVHFDRMRMGQYADCVPGIPKLLDFTDSLTMYLERSLPYRASPTEQVIDRWERWTIPGFERAVLEKVDHALVCSEVDAEVFRKAHTSHGFEVIENSVDLEAFKPRSHGDVRSPACTLTGTLFYFPNIDSVQYWVQEILPLVHLMKSKTRTRVIGTRPTRAIEALNGHDRIEVLSDVPNMASELFTEDVYVCPLRVGAGVRNKLLEAMAAGMGIVSTPLGCEGMNVESGKHMLIAETPQEFADAVLQLLDNQDIKAELGANARQYVEQFHDGEKLGQRLESTYQRLIAAGSKC